LRVVLLVLALWVILLPSLALAQELSGESPSAAVVFTPPSPILPDISGPIVLVSGVVEVQVFGPQIEFTRGGTPTIIPPGIVPPSPIHE
jgi:hypothetical protein